MLSFSNPSRSRWRWRERQPAGDEKGMPPESAVPESEYRVIAELWARAKRDGTIVEGAGRPTGRQATATDGRNETQEVPQKEQQQQQRQQRQQQKQAAETPNQQRRRAFDRRWRWTVAFWACLLAMHAGAIWLFTSGFLLTRLVLDDLSQCGQPPLDSHLAARRVDAGCWHPKMFDRAIVFVIDALRYDFAVPVAEAAAGGRHYLNALPFLHETAVTAPHNAFLRPFIADPPTTTLQRLKGLTTGTLPTFIDAGSNFAGTAIEEDNLLLQLRGAGKKIVHLGDDTWTALFPGHFEVNLSRAYDSFDVWDLHTVDKGVMDHMLPLVGQRGRWDVLIGHCLGVDHAGHRYGPDHPAMGAKLREMDRFVRELTAAIDDDTLLVVIGDHGMDTKGDHGGESDDEVQAALWMYAKRPVFGRTAPEHATPPATAKTRPVDQIDLVPTLALLLGIPIPYNSLGRPIEEAFAGGQGSDWANLAAVMRMAAAGTQRYQGSYFAARGLDQDDGPGSASQLWARVQAAGLSAREAYEGAARSQEETLRLCRRLWARFDVPRMAAGVALAAAGVAVLVAYALRCGTDGDGAGRPGRLVPRGFWGWMAVVFTVGHALGFASNSFTVWEDSVLLFLLATFGVAAAAASLRTAARAERAAAVYHALGFAGLGRLAWYSKLCREEQMAYCTSTYYASAASSTSAPWQLAVPFAVAAVLPPVVKSFLVPTRSYAGLAPAWIGYGFRAGLLLSAVYWVVDAADNDGWLGSRVPAGALKTAGVTLAQTALALALVAGTVAFAWAPPSVEVVRMAPVSGQRRVAIMGYANALGARYLLLPLNVLAGCLVLSKPMGAGALALMLWQVLSLAEVLDRTGLKAAPIGPVVLAMMGNFYFFRTGHQAVLSSIQWDSAFVALTRLRYPWAPLAVALNTFAGQAIAAASLPLLVLWKTEPRQRGVLGAVERAAAVFGAYYAVEAVASMACAAWLRRHLMLFRVFSPRFMMAAALLLLVNLLVLLVALTGVRTSMLSVGNVFGWPEP